MKEKITIQDRMLKEMFLRNREMGVEELCDNLKLKQSQILQGIKSLTARKLVKKNHQKNKASYKSAPYSKVFIKINNMEFVREMLNAKGLL